METIKEIKDITERSGSYAEMEGYEIVTTEQSIKLYIDNGQSCCENWGYFWCNDNPMDFIGATVLDVTLTGEALDPVEMKSNDLDPDREYFEGGVMFVNIETDKGTLQFVAYNEHNGYYGHTAKVVCSQLTSEEYL